MMNIPTNVSIYGQDRYYANLGWLSARRLRTSWRTLCCWVQQIFSCNTIGAIINDSSGFMKPRTGKSITSRITSRYPSCGERSISLIMITLCRNAIYRWSWPIFPRITWSGANSPLKRAGDPCEKYLYILVIVWILYNIIQRCIDIGPAHERGEERQRVFL